jgi:hypothetical protein
MQNTSELRARNPAEDRDIVSKGPPDLHQIAQQWENFARAQELGQIGWWRLDTTTNVLTWSEENYRIGRAANLPDLSRRHSPRRSTGCRRKMGRRASRRIL